MPHNKRLILSHFWVAFVVFALAAVLGVWQMWVRSPLAAPLDIPQRYYQSVTAHGVMMGYVLTTFFIMGFGYYVAETALKAPLPARRWAWAGFVMGVVGVALAAASILGGRASVLYTFYPPVTASVWFYLGLVLVVAGSWIWCVLMILAMRRFKQANPDVPVPLAMYGTVANAVLWLWTTVGVAAEIVFLIMPAVLGLRQSIDVGLSRTLFSWTLHAIVYFWLIPAYIAFYTMAPRAAGGRLFSDTMGRLTFALFLIYSLPVGMHHLFMDPQHATGFKFIQMSLTALVAAPTFLTVFTIAASFELAGRLRGGRGLLGWIAALPWERPMVLATGLAFFMLWFGGGGGLINMSFGMNAMVHNTSWVTAHFHLIFGGTVVIMYFAIAYEIWPSLTGQAAGSARMQRLQLWLWAAGMMIMTLPWHFLGLEGQWRRVASFDYSNPLIAGWGPWVVVSLVGGVILLASAWLFIWNVAPEHAPPMARRQPVAPRQEIPPYTYALAAHPPDRVPRLLNGFTQWNWLVAMLMAVAYGAPILQFLDGRAPEAVIHRLVGG